MVKVLGHSYAQQPNTGYFPVKFSFFIYFLLKNKEWISNLCRNSKYSRSWRVINYTYKWNYWIAHYSWHPKKKSNKKQRNWNLTCLELMDIMWLLVHWHYFIEILISKFQPPKSSQMIYWNIEISTSLVFNRAFEC